MKQSSLENSNADELCSSIDEEKHDKELENKQSNQIQNKENGISAQVSVTSVTDQSISKLSYMVNNFHIDLCFPSVC